MLPDHTVTALLVQEHRERLAEMAARTPLERRDASGRAAPGDRRTALPARRDPRARRLPRDVLSVTPDATEPAPGLTRWAAFHPEWKKEVACAAIDTADGLVLVDPLAPPSLPDARAFWRALDARARAAPHVHVLLTLHYHLRSAPEVVARYRKRPRSTLWAPVATAARLDVPVDRAFTPGDTLPGGIEAFPCGRDDEVVLWLPGAKALVSGDVLLGGTRKRLRVCPASWLPRGVTRIEVARALEPLRALPVEALVPLHGPPVTDGAREALAAALDEVLDAPRRA